MTMVRKRNGKQEDFDKQKIAKALTSAFEESFGDEGMSVYKSEIEQMTEDVARAMEAYPKVCVEEIQDFVEDTLMEYGFYDVVKEYIKYRYLHEIRRQSHNDAEFLTLIQGDNEYWHTENSNKNAEWVTTQRDYLAGIVSKDIARTYIFPKEAIKAHDEGLIHIHDLDYAAQATLTNCCLCNLNDMLQNGTTINGVKIDKPHRLITAATLASQIIASVASSQYGGTTITMTHLAPFVRDSYNKYKAKYASWGFNEEDSCRFADFDTRREVKDSVQTLIYQLNSLTTTNGQSPFISIFLYLGETQEYKKELALLIQEILEQRYLGMKNKKGVYVSPAFPKLLYCLEEDNIHEDSPYWYLTQLAAKVSAKRLVPDYISEKKMRELKLSKGEEPGSGDCFPCMGCRSFLTPDRSGNGYENVSRSLDYDPSKPKYYGRYNLGVVTINLADVALSSGGNFKKFWELLNERLELIHEVHKVRIDRLSKTKAKVAPILWCDGAFARLDPEDTLDEIIHGGTATISTGYAGLYECVKYMTGESHTSSRGHDFAVNVMRHLNDKCDEWKKQDNVDHSIYGSPIETTTYKFSKCLKKRFGVIEGITDRDYVTNSYHIPVFEEIDPFKKLKIEAEFQELSPGGMISYIESSNLENNTEAVLEIIKYIYDNTLYAEINTKSDYCQCCGYDKEILMNRDDDGKWYWYCPNCGNTDMSKMNIARRVCGYISTNPTNQGRMDDIANRYVHLDDHSL